MKHLLILFFLLPMVGLSAQTINGNFSLLSNQTIRLEGFSGLKTCAISSTTTDEKGNFQLRYSKADFGVGYLIAADEKPLFVILSGEDIEIIGTALRDVQTIRVKKERKTNGLNMSLAQAGRLRLQ